MTNRDIVLRLEFLLDVTRRGLSYLLQTDERLFAQPFTLERAASLHSNPTEAEQVEAFGSRFGRLQDVIGNKLLPTLLVAMEEPTGAVLTNLNRAEQLGWIPSATQWTNARQLRNQLVHEYVDDPQLLSDALNTAHQYIPMLQEVAQQLSREADNYLSTK